MAREPIPVNPEIIAWARERAGYSSENAARRFKKIEAWEAGEISPTYPQLEQLADAFKLPIAVFFFPDPPDLPPIDETFRTLPTEEFDRIPPKVRQLLGKAKAFQLNLHELYHGRNPAERLITKTLVFKPDTTVPNMADAARKFIGITLEEQRSWRDADQALDRWRQALLSVGIFVFKDSFREDGYSGFCLHDEVFPIIYVNNGTAKTRQIFTLFHELAHLLFRTSGVDALDDAYISNLTGEARKIELLCNEFAAEFLLPDAVFIEDFKKLDPTEQTAELLARHYHVSRESIFRRFLDRNLIDRDVYATAAEKWRGQEKRGSGGHYYWTKTGSSSVCVGRGSIAQPATPPQGGAQTG